MNKNTLIVLKLLSLLLIAVIAVSVAWIGTGTFLAMHNIFTPPPKGEMGALDWFWEINLMDNVLNWALPTGVFCLLAESIIEIIRKKFNVSFLIISFTALFCISLPAIMLFQFFIYMHEGAFTWERIWWAFFSTV
jgi:hypothetical protein